MHSIFSIFILFVFSQIANGQSSLQTKEIPAEIFGVSQGLSQGYVSSIIQDKEGFIWFSTNDGLNKYDGYKVTVYRNNPKDSFSLPDNMIADIAEDENENFWVATRAKGLFLFDKKTERFFPVHFPYLKTETGLNDMKYRNRKLFLNIYNNFLLVDIPNKKLTLPLSTKNENFHVLFDYNVQDSISKLGSKIYNTTSVLWPEDNVIWVVNTDLALRFKLDTINRSWHPTSYDPIEFGIPNNAKQFISLKQNLKNENEIIVISNQTLSITNLITKQRIFEIRIPRISLVPVELADGNLLISSQDGSFHILDIQQRKLFPCNFKKMDFKFEVENSYRDANGIVWYGTSGFGAILSDSKKSNFDTKDARFYRNLFFGDEISGIQNVSKQLKEEMNQYFNFTQITEDKQGNFWLYLQNTTYPICHLIKFDSKAKKVQIIKASNNNPNSSHIYNDKQDRLWIYSDLGQNNVFLDQINKVDGSIQKRYRIPAGNFLNELPFIRNFYCTDQGVLYMSTANGLFRFNPDEKDTNLMWRKYQHIEGDSTSLVSNSLWCVCPDPVSPSKYLWLGTTANGLSRFEIVTGKCIHFSEANGLPNNVVYGILPDQFNNLWLSTNKGLSCFNPSNLTFLNYVAEDGLQGDEFNSFQYMKLKTGELYFGGVNGYTIFNPEVVLQKQKEVPIVFTELSIANKIIDWKTNPEILNAPIPYAKQIVLRPSQNMFTISFASLEYRSNKKKYYKYKLIGFHNEYTEPSIKNEATFSNLSPATYTLQVTGTNTDGVWNSKGISIEIIVLPAWYQTWWFRSLILFLLASLIYAFYRYRLHQQTQVLRMRNRIAADLHDEIGSTLSSISIFSEAAKKITEGNNSAAKVLNKISQNSTEVMETMSDIVWAINSSNDKIDNLINRIRIYAVQISESAYFDLHLAENDQIPDFKLDMYQRKHVYLLFKEAINNIAKYAQCKHVWIEFEASHSQFKMRIKDDGIGFDMNGSNEAGSLGGNGLFNMRKRADDLGGILLIHSNIGKGTLIELKINL